MIICLPAVKPFRPEPPTIEDIFNPKDPKPSTLAGLQRLEWDIRYDRATDFPGLIMWDATTRGPMGLRRAAIRRCRP